MYAVVDLLPAQNILQSSHKKITYWGVMRCLFRDMNNAASVAFDSSTSRGDKSSFIQRGPVAIVSRTFPGDLSNLGV